MDIKRVRELSRLMRDYDLSELEFKDGDTELRLSKGGSAVPVAPAVPVSQPPPAAAPAPSEAAPASGQGGDEFAGCQQIVSPIPGTVYLKPNPDAPAFVEVGSTVADGDVVCLVEAMKVFNEIKSEGVSGSVKKVCVEDGQPVEYGTVLFLIG